jgi:hypothetical protein
MNIGAFAIPIGPLVRSAARSPTVSISTSNRCYAAHALARRHRFAQHTPTDLTWRMPLPIDKIN